MHSQLNVYKLRICSNLSQLFSRSPATACKRDGIISTPRRIRGGSKRASFVCLVDHKSEGRYETCKRYYKYDFFVSITQYNVHRFKYKQRSKGIDSVEQFIHSYILLFVLRHSAFMQQEIVCLRGRSMSFKSLRHIRRQSPRHPVVPQPPSWHLCRSLDNPRSCVPNRRRKNIP
jgi:hypothetical protein